MAIQARMLIRELLLQKQQTLLLILCVTLAVGGVSAVGGFEARINAAVERDARRLHAADVIVSSSFPLTAAVEQYLDTMQQKHLIRTARTWEFYTLTRTQDGKRSLLTAAKTVESGYPFYGTVELQSGRPFAKVLTPGSIIVEQGLLDRLGVAIGDEVRIGEATLRIVDVVRSEPDRPVTVFSFGPRVFINAADRDRLGLIETGSRVRRKALAQIIGPISPAQLVRGLEAVADPAQERVDTFRSADSRLKRFFDNLIFFMKLIGIFTLLLAGIGVHSVFEALLRSRLKTITVMKALGARNGFIMRLYLSLALTVGLVGTLSGLLLGILLQTGLTRLLAGLLPATVAGGPAWGALLESLCIGLVAVVLFAARPILLLRHLRPAALFRYEPSPRGLQRGEWMVWGMAALLFTVLVLRHLEDVRTGAYFIGGTLILLAIIFAICRLILAILPRLPWHNLLLRQAVRGLFRPRNSTLPALVTLTASTTIILSIYLVENNLRTNFVSAYPPHAPNTFVLDIQPAQQDALRATVAKPLIFYPVIRARLTAINDAAIDQSQERLRKSDNLARPFNLTYRAKLLDNEAFVKGDQLFAPGGGALQVSVLDRVAEIGRIRIGDRLDFNIQGVPLSVTVASIRTLTHEGLQPYFYFVFPEEALRGAPQTLFTAIREVPSAIPRLQSRLVEAFPNITVIDASQTIQRLAAALSKFARVIRFFTLFSVAAGLLLVLSSIVATRAARIREAVYYRILGARRRFVQWVFTVENLFLGLFSAALGLLLAQLIAWGLCTQRFEIAYDPQTWLSLVVLSLSTTIIAALGWGASRSIMALKPIQFLRRYAVD